MQTKRFRTATLGLGILLVGAVVVWAATGTYRETRIPNFANGIQVNGVTAFDGSGDLTTQTTLTAEGSTSDGFETTVTFTDPTADRAVTVPNAAGTVMLSSLATNGADVANAITGASNALVAEGATADGFETTVTFTDPTADRTVTVPDAPGTVMLSSLATNGADAANAVTGASNALVAEGATADGFETTVTFTDPTADRTVTVPDAPGTVMLSSLATNGADAANAVTGASNALVFEGATADTSETSLVPQDPTADRTATLPNASGTVNMGFMTQVVFCGEQANNGTIYMSPVSGYAGGALYAAGTTANDLSYAIGGTGCDGEDDATEGTADEVLFANNAAKILGMYCAVSSSGSNGVVLNLRSATADLTPDVTITIATGATTGATVATTTTDIAAGATMALRVINTEDLSAQDAWCVANVMVLP